MKSYPTLRRWLAAGLTLSVFAMLLAGMALSTHSRDETKGGPNGAVAAHGWTMFGGSIHRNFVNPFERNISSEWNIESGSEKNVKWSTDLGSKAYGGPIVAGGKIFVGTNNKKARNPRDVDKTSKEPLDKGIIMCFRESDGKFLWQAVHDKLAAGRVNDWPEEGICSSPTVEGNRLYYVSNRCELICADTEGFLDGKNDGVQDEKYKEPTDADIVWRLDMIKDLNVFPHNLADCSPLVIGDMIFVVTSNGVDEGHINIPSPRAPSFIAVDKKTGKVLWQKNYPTMNLLKPGANLKDLVDRGLVLMHGQWSNPVYAEVNGKGQIIFPAATAGCTLSSRKRATLSGSSIATPRAPSTSSAPRARGVILWLPRSSTRTKSTSASARTLSTRKASATCGVLTLRRGATSLPSTITSIRRTRSTRARLWSGTMVAGAGGQ